MKILAKITAILPKGKFPVPSGLYSIFLIIEFIDSSIDKKGTYGVLPYIAPEILQGNPLTETADIYSFGIIMWTLSAGIRPWCNRPHDFKLASEICNGIRPDIIDGTPYDYVKLMTQCWHSDISKRPTASEIYDLLGSWITAICDEPDQNHNRIIYTVDDSMILLVKILATNLS
ncbi:14557_t:CDS:2 [Funneliformis geosporum]|nr:14557_t:CDS:2 [Funneliformis geosporum]